MYKVTWTPVVGQVLHVQSKYSNTYDRFAVATSTRCCFWTAILASLVALAPIVVSEGRGKLAIGLKNQ